MYDTLLAITVIFVVAAVLLVAAAQYPLPTVPLYIVAGIAAGLVIDEGLLLELAQWGIALIVFLFGVHVDLSAVRSRSRTSAVVGTLQATLVGALGFGAGVALGLSLENALFLGIAAGLSSSLVSTSYLDDSSSPASVTVELAESIHLVEDLLGVAVIVGLSAVVFVAEPTGLPVAGAVGLLAAALVIRYVVFDRLTAPISDDPELLMLVSFTFAIGAIAVAEAVGLSMVVGAFAAGIAVADDYPHSLALVDTLEDLEDFFAPIFFVTIGALLAWPSVETAGYTVVIVAATLFFNPVLVAALLLKRGYNGRTAAVTGLSLNQVSALSLFVAIEAVGAEVIDRSVFDAIILAAILTMVVTVYTTTWAGAISQWARERRLFERVGESPSTSLPADELTNHVIVAGSRYGGTGLRGTDESADRELVFVGDDRELTRTESTNYVYGDVSDERVWERARLADASAVISLYPDESRTRTVSSLETDAPLIVRADSSRTADEWLERGVSGVIETSQLTADAIRDVLESTASEDTENSDPSSN